MNPKQQYKLCHRLYRMDNRCAELRRLLPDDYEPDVCDGDPDEEQYELASLEYWSLSDTCKRLNIGGRFHIAAQRSIAMFLHAAPDEPSALDALCFAASGDDDSDDPRSWTGVA